MKTKQIDVRFLSWNNCGDLAVSIDGRKYMYRRVSPFWRDKLKLYIRHKNWRNLFRSLKHFGED